MKENNKNKGDVFYLGINNYYGYDILVHETHQPQGTDLIEVADNAFKGCNKLERLIINKYGTPKSCKQASTWEEFIRKIIKEAHTSK